MARKLRQGEGRKNEIIRIEHLLGSSPHTPISQIRTKRLRDVQSPPGGQRCLAAELSYILSMTPHRERLSAALPHSACHHSPVSKAQVLGVPGQSKKAGRWGAVPLRPQGPLYFSFLFPHFPLFFTLGPSQGPDTLRGAPGGGVWRSRIQRRLYLVARWPTCVSVSILCHAASGLT